MTITPEQLAAMIADAKEIASERHEKANESHMMAMMVRNSANAGAADSWQMAADYALRTARILDQTSDLAQAYLTSEAARIAAEAEVERGMPVMDDWDVLIRDAKTEAEKAMRKFPQPNYVISKFAEEAGEVVKAAIHCAENRETPENLRGEMKQAIAMLYRLWVEGDQVHGLPPIRAALQETAP